MRVGSVWLPLIDIAQDRLEVDDRRSVDRLPIGLHRVRVLSLDGIRIQVSGLEAIDGTPIVDVKPVLRRRLDA